MCSPRKALLSVVFLAMLMAVGCRAQTPAGDKLSPDLARRVEILLRSKSSVPPNYTIQVGPRTRSDVTGFSQIEVTFTADGKSKSLPFLLSEDGKTLAQFTKFDISQDPKTLVSGAGRPARGGPTNAPVSIVVFDDLECPFCAKMHAQLFPALTARYKDQVRIVYKDFPLDQHPWAMRAAIDTNCLGAESSTGYWNMVDYVHAHAAELGGAEKSLAKANETLDTLARDEGKRQKVNGSALEACLAKQDKAPIEASVKVAEGLGVGATPALFINGERLDGAWPLEDVYRMIDGALVAAGQTPPPVAAPVTPTPNNSQTQPATGPASGGAGQPSAKPGS